MRGLAPIFRKVHNCYHYQLSLQHCQHEAGNAMVAMLGIAIVTPGPIPPERHVRGDMGRYKGSLHKNWEIVEWEACAVFCLEYKKSKGGYFLFHGTKALMIGQEVGHNNHAPISSKSYYIIVQLVRKMWLWVITRKSSHNTEKTFQTC